MAKEQMVEGRAVQRFYSAFLGNVRRGERVVASLSYMRHLVDIGVVTIDRKPAGPAETKPAGPAETKGGAAAKKSFGAATDGRSTNGPSSSAPGRGIASLFSAAVRPLLTATGSGASAARKLIATVGRSRASR